MRGAARNPPYIKVPIPAGTPALYVPYVGSIDRLLPWPHSEAGGSLPGRRSGMDINLMNAVRSFFSAPRKDAGESRTRAAVLSMTSWPARKVRHEVQLLEKQDDQATVWCPAHVDIGESVWMEEGERAVKCDVKSLVATGGGYRLNLSVSDKTRRCDERTVCNTPGDLEWVDGFTRVRCPVRITNLTLHGVQVMLSRPAPEIRSVRLQFHGQAAAGTIRYCVRIGASYIAGIEFV